MNKRSGIYKVFARVVLSADVLHADMEAVASICQRVGVSYPEEVSAYYEKLKEHPVPTTSRSINANIVSVARGTLKLTIDPSTIPPDAVELLINIDEEFENGY